MSAKPLSLEAFAAKNPAKGPGRPCWACIIPEAEEINSARRQEVAITVIRDWLIKEKGYEPGIATSNRLTHHFSNSRHHERNG
jgi:hypothetical protein